MTVEGSLLRAAVTGLTLIAFTGCTALQPLGDRVTYAETRDEIEPGDRVELTTDRGVLYLTVTKVDAEAIHGRTHSGKRFKVLHSAIRSVRVEQFHAGRTIGTVGIMIGIAATVFLIILIEALDDLGS